MPAMPYPLRCSPLYLTFGCCCTLPDLVVVDYVTVGFVITFTTHLFRAFCCYLFCSCCSSLPIYPSHTHLRFYPCVLITLICCLRCCSALYVVVVVVTVGYHPLRLRCCTFTFVVILLQLIRYIPLYHVIVFCTLRYPFCCCTLVIVVLYCSLPLFVLPAFTMPVCHPPFAHSVYSPTR